MTSSETNTRGSSSKYSLIKKVTFNPVIEWAVNTVLNSSRVPVPRPMFPEIVTDASRRKAFEQSSTKQEARQSCTRVGSTREEDTLGMDIWNNAETRKGKNRRIVIERHQ